MNISVDKIGGAALAEPPVILTNLVNEVLKESSPNPTIFVVSAIGKQTRMLDEIFIDLWNRKIKDCEKKFTVFADFHRARVNELGIVCKIEQLLWEMDRYLHKNAISINRGRERAKVLKFGELISSCIFSGLLHKLNKDFLYVDARSMIATKNNVEFDKALVDFDLTNDKVICHLNRFRQNIILTEGFIAREHDSGDDALLDFDGSDYTAAVITHILRRRGNNMHLNYWKNVDGVISDFISGGSSVIEDMTQKEYASMFPAGSAAPVRLDSILLFDPEPNNLEIKIRSYLNLDKKGTTIKF